MYTHYNKMINNNNKKENDQVCSITFFFSATHFKFDAIFSKLFGRILIECNCYKMKKKISIRILNGMIFASEIFYQKIGQTSFIKNVCSEYIVNINTRKLTCGKSIVYKHLKRENTQKHTYTHKSIFICFHIIHWVHFNISFYFLVCNTNTRLSMFLIKNK